MTPVEVIHRLARAYRFILDLTITPHVVESPGATTIYVELRDVWYFLDSCHVGVFEGLLASDGQRPGRRPDVKVALFDDHNGVFRIEI
jgi:hypothetical protein